MGIVDQLRQTYNGKKVFLTGHTGFKGSWLLVLLNRLGAKVKGFALEPGSMSLYSQIDGDQLCSSIIGDIRDGSRLQTELLSFKPDFVFHLAAQPLVRASYESPIETYAVNTMGTANILEALRSLPGRVVSVIITTDKVYQNPELGEPFQESDPLGGHDPYSASKAAAEIIVASYRVSFFSNDNFAVHQKSLSTARAGNVIGGGDWAKDRLVPDVIRSLMIDQELIIRYPKAVRPWQHVIEPLVGYLSLAQKQSQHPTKYNEAWNFGPHPSQHRLVEEVVNSIVRQWGKGKIRIVPDLQKHEASFLKLDISKSIRHLGWSPCLSTDQTIDWTTEWYYRTGTKGEEAKSILEQQLDRYFKLLCES